MLVASCFVRKPRSEQVEQIEIVGGVGMLTITRLGILVGDRRS